MIASLPIQPMDLALNDLELHIHGCAFCLVEGNELCYEGRFLAEDAAIRRQDIQRPTRRPIRHFVLLRREGAEEAAVA